MNWFPLKTISAFVRTAGRVAAFISTARYDKSSIASIFFSSGVNCVVVK